MSKPTIEDTRWAVTALGVESTTQSDPDGTLKDDGYQDDDIPDPRDWNWWHRKAHKWFQYLDAAILSGNHAFDGSVTVGGQSLSLPSVTFTADSTTDQLHVAAHGLSLGDGPLQVSNVGGALPSELLPSKNYWAMPTDSDHFQVASSFLNAVMGFHVDLLSDGTGTNSVVGVSAAHATDAVVSRSLTVGATIQTGAGVTVGGQSVTFPSVTFTANSGTDKLTVVGHGLATGDGPLLTSNSGGALPAPLLAATNYWPIVDPAVDVDTFKLAISRAYALSGIAIDLTSNGSGTNSIVGSSPTRASSLVVSGNVSVGGELIHQDDRPFWFGAACFLGRTTGTMQFDPTGSAPHWNFPAGTVFGNIDCPVNSFRPGSVIKSVTGYFDKNGDASTLGLLMNKSALDLSSRTNVTGGLVNDSTSAVGLATATFTPNYQVEPDWWLVIQVNWTPASSAGSFYGVKIIANG